MSERKYLGDEALLSGRTCSVCGRPLGTKMEDGMYDISGGLQIEFETGEWSHLDCEGATKPLGILYGPVVSES